MPNEETPIVIEIINFVIESLEFQNRLLNVIIHFISDIILPDFLAKFCVEKKMTYFVQCTRIHKYKVDYAARNPSFEFFPFCYNHERLIRRNLETAKN